MGKAYKKLLILQNLKLFCFILCTSACLCSSPTWSPPQNVQERQQEVLVATFCTAINTTQRSHIARSRLSPLLKSYSSSLYCCGWLKGARRRKKFHRHPFRTRSAARGKIQYFSPVQKNSFSREPEFSSFVRSGNVTDNLAKIIVKKKKKDIYSYILSRFGISHKSIELLIQVPLRATCYFRSH